MLLVNEELLPMLHCRQVLSGRTRLTGWDGDTGKGWKVQGQGGHKEISHSISFNVSMAEPPEAGEKMGQGICDFAARNSCL